MASPLFSFTLLPVSKAGANNDRVAGALFSGKIKICELSLCYGEQLIITWLRAWLVTLSNYMDFEINESQSKKTAIFILEECYMLNLAELSLLFKRIMKGHYGYFFNKFNGQIIIQACRDYRKERGLILSKAR